MFRFWRRVRAVARAISPRVASHRVERSKAYNDRAPHPQNAIDIFAGEWTSKLPPPFDNLTAGRTVLFDDERIAWAIERVGGVAGQRILELGPLEGGHTYLLDRAGAADVLAIEANPQAYLKCLVTKELLGIRAARFVHGDFVAYLRETRERFDVVLASGVLYHMVNPVELIARIAAVTDAVYLWTHYYDPAVFGARSATAARVVEPEPAEHEGFRHALHRNDYGKALNQHGFCGGSRPYSYWLSRDDIIGALRHFGLADIELAYQQPDNPNGPAFAVLAKRSDK